MNRNSKHNLQSKVRTTTVRAFLFGGLIALLAGCQPSEPTRTKAEFLHDDALLKSTRQFCNQNPAERQGLPNCINSNDAGSTRMALSCFGGREIDHACLDKLGYKR